MEVIKGDTRSIDCSSYERGRFSGGLTASKYLPE